MLLLCVLNMNTIHTCAVSIQCLLAAYGVDLSDEAQKQQLGVEKTLEV